MNNTKCIPCEQARIERRNNQESQNREKAIKHARENKLKEIIITQTPNGIHRFRESGEALKPGFSDREYIFFD